MKRKSLWKVSVTSTSEAEDAVAGLLSAILNQPATVYCDVETSLSTVTVYLQQKLDSWRKVREAISVGLKWIKSCGLRIGPGKIVIAKVGREDWAESWKRYFKPIEIGINNRRGEPCETPFLRRKSGARVTRPSEDARMSLLIKPSWSKRKPRKGQAVIVLDPGLSFGTGQHPTTSFCLHQIVAPACGEKGRHSQCAAAQIIRLAPRGTSGARKEERGIPSKNAHPRPAPLLHCMEERERTGPAHRLKASPANRFSLKPPSFLDLGTGSGILAIAAAKLGYSPVHAIDFDAEAVRVARTNAHANGVHPKVKIRRSDVSKLPIRPGHRGQRFDLVCANLTSDLLMAQRRRIAAQLNRTGTLVLAGILRSEFAAVQKAYKTLGLSLLSLHREREWCSGSFRLAH